MTESPPTESSQISVNIGGRALSDEAKTRVQEALTEVLESELRAATETFRPHNKVVQTFSRSSG